MSDRKMVMHGPVVFEMKVHVINPETERRAVLTVGMGAGKYPTPEEVKERIDKLNSGELENAAPGFELMDRSDFMADLMEEHAGHRMHVACPNDWDAIES